MRIGGIVSTGALDRQQERVVQDGLNFSPFLDHGWFNDNHGQKTTDVLGYPTTAKRVKKGERLPNGTASDHDGWWAEGYLVNTDEGRKVYALARSLSKSPNGRGLGFSIEGKVGARDKRDQTTITSADIHNVAITHVPVNTETSLRVLAKAMMAGSAITNPGTAPGEGFPLRVEALDGTLAVTTYEDGDDEEEMIEWEPHPEANAILPQFRKADMVAEVQPMTTVDYIEYLSEALGDWVPTEPSRAERVTKAEAHIIVANRFPNWSVGRVNDFVESGGFDTHDS